MNYQLGGAVVGGESIAGAAAGRLAGIVDLGGWRRVGQRPMREQGAAKHGAPNVGPGPDQRGPADRAGGALR